MGKRSNFPRISKDLYRTIDPVAIEVLKPFLKPGCRFVEPCVGYYDLVNGLQRAGHCCVFASDLKKRPGVMKMDARKLSPYYVNTADNIITNPPWSRPILHELIVWFASLRPTWLLFDADWAHTKQSIPFHELCTDIVPAGRLQWIPNTAMKGKDNCAWYRFSRAEAGNATVFHDPVRAVRL